MNVLHTSTYRHKEPQGFLDPKEPLIPIDINGRIVNRNYRSSTKPLPLLGNARLGACASGSDALLPHAKDSRPHANASHAWLVEQEYQAPPGEDGA